MITEQRIKISGGFYREASAVAEDRKRAFSRTATINDLTSYANLWADEPWFEPIPTLIAGLHFREVARILKANGR
jgi:hypothetical protein